MNDLKKRRAAASAELAEAAFDIADDFEVCPACLITAIDMAVEAGTIHHVEDRHVATSDDDAFDSLVAELAHIFKKHFRMKPTVLGPSGEPSTPFVAFAIAACAEFGKTVTASQVSDAGRRRGIPEDT